MHEKKQKNYHRAHPCRPWINARCFSQVGRHEMAGGWAGGWAPHAVKGPRSRRTPPGRYCALLRTVGAKKQTYRFKMNVGGHQLRSRRNDRGCFKTFRIRRNSI